MTIRPEQLGAFEAAALDSFEARILTHVNDYFPEFMAEHGEEEGRNVIRAMVWTADKYGFTSEQDVGQYILLALLHGLDAPDADSAWIFEVLRRPDLTSAERLELLWHWTDHDLGVRED